MSRLKTSVLITLTVVLGISAVADAAIRRVPARLNVFEVYGGYSQPISTVEGILLQIDNDGFVTDKFVINNRIIDVNADDAYDPSFYLGLKWGSTFGGLAIGKIGFQYSNYQIKDAISLTSDTLLDIADLGLNYNQFDVSVDLNLYAGNPVSMPVNPYVGLGLHAGILAVSSDGGVEDPDNPGTFFEFETEYHGNVAASLNFGLDIKLAEAPSGRSFWVLASDNRWDFAATNDRPKQLQIGGAVRYFFRM